MFFRIERGSSVPISRQIAEQVRAQCLAGTLAAGAQLPSVRQLARDLAVNQNTVLRVYEKLAAEGWLEMRHGEGTFVAGKSPAGQHDQQRQQFLDELRRVVRQGRLLGLTRRELRQSALAAVDAACQPNSLSAPAGDSP